MISLRINGLSRKIVLNKLTIKTITANKKTAIAAINICRCIIGYPKNKGKNEYAAIIPENISEKINILKNILVFLEKIEAAIITRRFITAADSDNKPMLRVTDLIISSSNAEAINSNPVHIPFITMKNINNFQRTFIFSLPKIA